MGFALSFTVGIGVGVIYALLGICSPAPPIIALLGLLGMVVGEQGTLLVWQRHAATTAAFALT